MKKSEIEASHRDDEKVSKKRCCESFSVWETNDSGTGCCTTVERRFRSEKKAINNFMSEMIGFLVPMGISPNAELLSAMLKAQGVHVEVKPPRGAKYRDFYGERKQRNVVFDCCWGKTAQGPGTSRVRIKV